MAGENNTTLTNETIANGTSLAGNGSNTTDGIVGIATLEQLQFAKNVLFFYILPFIAIVGIIGNTMSLSILLKVNKRAHAFNSYLMALTSSDVLLLLLALSRCVFLMVSRYPDERYPGLTIYGDFYLGIVFGSWIQRISATLISIIAIERFLAVAFPFRIKSFALDKYPHKIIAGVLLITLLCQLPTFILLDVIQTENPETNTTDYGYGFRFPTDAAMVTRQIYLVFLAIITNIIPLLIVFTSTVAILIFLKMRSTAMRLSRISVNEAKERETMTLTLVSMALIFTLCYIPSIIIYAIASSNSEFYKRETILIAIVVDVNIVCVCINSASDFAIYFLRSKEFRRLFVAKFFPCVQFLGSPIGTLTHDSTTPGTKNVCQSEGSLSASTSESHVSDTVEM